jgi:hypothetical protein
VVPHKGTSTKNKPTVSISLQPAIEFSFIRWAGPEAQVDTHPECALYMGVRWMRDVNEVEDKYGPMTAPTGSGNDPQGRRAET